MRILKTNKWVFAVILSILTIPVMAAEYSTKREELLALVYNNIFLVLASVIILAVVIAMIRLIFNFIELQKIRTMKELGVEKEDVVSRLNIPSWKKIYSWAWSIVPVKEEKNIDLGHDYDGIRELDNRLPPWWLGIMYGSIIFAVVYMFIYHWGGNEWSSKMEYTQAMEQAEIQKERYMESKADAIDENTVKFINDEASLSNGETIYKTNCSACHGTLGEGIAGLGPNMTDDYWIHGGSINDIFSTIKYGVLEKGMIAWNSQLRPSDIQDVSSFILTLQGTNPPNAKEKEGTLYIRESAEVPETADTTDEQSL